MKWKNYKTYESTWESKIELISDGVGDLIDDYENEINDCISNVSLDKPNTYEGKDFKVSFTGTELGDDCQVNISELE